MSLSLFSETDTLERRSEALGPGAVVLRAFARPSADALIEAMNGVVRRNPFRCMTTPGGYRMSVAMTSCGAAGWVTDRTGYRYDAFDPAAGER
jgi:DNA oxidative demethylase